MPAENGNKVKIEYTGSLDDGTVFDSSEKHGQPLEFELGSGQIIKGLDAAVSGMEVNEEKDVTIESTDAYGDPNPEMVKKVPKEKIQAGQEVKPGMQLGLGLPNGQQMPVMVTDVSENEVTIDMNHPLAGKRLHFKVKVLTIGG